MTELPLESLIEATLFSSGKSMSVAELSKVLGYDEDEMLDCLGSLQATLKRRKGGALQLAEVGDRGPWKSNLASLHTFQGKQKPTCLRSC